MSEAIHDCGDCRGIKNGLICYQSEGGYTLKIWDRIIDRRLRDSPFGFMPCRGMADAIFAVRKTYGETRENRTLHNGIY